MEKIAASIAQIAAEAQLKPGAEIGLTGDLPPPVSAGLAAWIAHQPEPKPTIRDAIRTALAEWLFERGYMRPEQD